MAADHPILRIAPSAVAKRIKGSPPKIPSRAIPVGRQGNRLGGKFSTIQEDLAKYEQARLVDDPAAVAPERAIVFEVFGQLVDFVKAASELDLEWLGEFDAKWPDDEDLFPSPKKADDDDDDEEGDGAGKAATIDGKLYLSMPNEASLKRLLALWRRFSRNAAPNKEEAPWWKLFSQLRDLRVWSEVDRIDATTQEYIRNKINSSPDSPVQVELDLWYHGTAERRIKAFNALKVEISDLGGEILDSAEINEINYVALLVSIPVDKAKELSERTGHLAFSVDVMQIRPQSNFTSVAPEMIEKPQFGSHEIADVPDQREIIGALIDGYPFANHDLLRNRIDVVEVDVPEAKVLVAQRMHATQMASLILHGDLSLDEPSIDRVIQVVPVLQTDAHGNETIPPNKLPLAIIHRAVLRLVGQPGSEGTAPKVVVINHSIADTNNPFAGRISPWARLLDYLSFKHKILFVVSAGNISNRIPIANYKTVKEFQDDNAIKRSGEILVAVEKAKGMRGLLNPAETINNITVGGVHADGTAGNPTASIEPFSNRMTQINSAVGLGFRGTIKPELLAPGGRQIVRPLAIPGKFSIVGDQVAGMGNVCAVPSTTSGETGRQYWSTGTSNAAANTTRAALKIADALDDAFDAEATNWVDLPARASMLKALLVHGCAWGSIGNVLEKAFPPPESNQHHARRTTISKFLGYGEIDSTRVISGSRYRATMLGDGEIGDDERHEYRIPLPPDLQNKRHPRRLIITLAWQSPVQPMSQYYQGIKLRVVDQQRSRQFWKGVKKNGVLQPPSTGTEKGTTFHLVLEGKNAAAFTNDGVITFNVQAMAYGKAKFEDLKAPYAMAVTLEIEETIRSDVFSYLRDNIKVPQRVRRRERIR